MGATIIAGDTLAMAQLSPEEAEEAEEAEEVPPPDEESREQDSPPEASRFYQALSLEAVREAATLHARAVSRANMALRMPPNEGIGELLFAESEIRRARGILPLDMNIHWASIEIANLVDSMSEPAELGTRRAHYKAELLSFRANHSEINADSVAFALAILAVKEARFGEAIREYQLALERTRDSGLRQTTLANLGEAWMLAGELDRAAEAFKRALDHASAHPISPRSHVLALMGAAVALDRLDDESEAIALASAARALSRGEVSELRDPSVFFEPEGEIAIYDYLSAKALAHEADLSSNAHIKHGAERRARQALETFLEIAKESPYRAHAERRLEALSP